MTRKTFRMSYVFRMVTIVPALATVTAATVAPAADTKPRMNLVFILADDLGWRDLGCYGSTFYETPHLDRLAGRGMRFTQAYAANPLCSPTRASILTGLYPARIGITAPVCHLPQEVFEEKLARQGAPEHRALQAASATRLKTEYVTLAEVLKAAGYATGHFGKWHLGREPYSPLQQGFDVDVPHWPGPGPAGYIAPWRSKRFNLPAQPGEHVEELMSQQAVRFIQAHKDEPFYLNYWAFSVHAPHDSKDELIAYYRRKAATLPADSPQRNPVNAAMIHCLDQAVGRIIQAIDEAGIADRTIIVFFSDNGGIHWADHSYAARVENPPVDVPITSNAPLRGGKATIYEGGTREPCLIVWPGVTQPGTVSDAIIQSIDFYPTLLEMLDVPMPTGQPCDGKSFVQALRGRPFERGPLLCHFPHYTPRTGAIPSCYVRVGDWKLIRFFCDNKDQTDRFELYNLADDLSEQHNLAEQKPDKVKELNQLIDRFLADTHAVVPKRNPNYRPTVAGWRALRDCTISLEDGALTVHSTGRDPGIMTRDVPKVPGPFIFELRMKSNSHGAGQVYWATDKRGTFKSDQSFIFAVGHNNQWIEYSMRLRVDKPITALRLDPCTAPGTVQFAWLRLLDTQKRVLAEWRFK